MTNMYNLKRSINGILLFDKPLDISSSSAMLKCKAIFQAKKAGHTGSLDPKASGLLPICMGEATKFSSYFLAGDKGYIATAKLGIRTTTQDSEGEIIHKQELQDEYLKLADVIKNFIGEIKQTPSIYSAIKVNGKALYKYARANESVDIPSRQVHIYSINLLDSNIDSFKIEVRCSKGTYIRSLVDDIGLALGCGAYVTSLHRTYDQGLPSAPLYSLEKLNELKLQCQKQNDFSKLDECLIPLEQAFNHLAHLDLPEDIAKRLLNGLSQNLHNKGYTYDKSLHTQAIIALYCKQKFIGVGRFANDDLLAVRMLSQVDL